MTDSRFTFTDRARPVVEIGIGDTRVDVGVGQWDVALWDDDRYRWASTEPTWLDVSCFVQRAECEYGRAAVTDRFVAGTATVLVDNETGWADPDTTNEPGALSLRPGRAIRLGVDHVELGRRWLFRGFIDAMIPTYLPNGTDAVELACIDALGEVGRAKFPDLAAPIGGGDLANERIVRILDRAQWPTAKRKVDESGTALIASTIGGQAADLLGVVAESVGGAVYGDLDGDVVFRNRDWQAFPAGTPPDGTIGNMGAGTPAVDGYLTPSVGTVSTPDTPDLNVAGPVRLSWKVRPVGLTVTNTDQTLGGQWGGSSGNVWYFAQRQNQSGPIFGASADGVAQTIFSRVLLTAELAAVLPDGVDGYIGIRFDPAGARVTAETSTDGVTWTAAGTTYTYPPLIVIDGTQPLRVGARGPHPSPNPWQGRIYWAQMETLDAVGNSSGVVWRFDANEYPTDGSNPTSYVDPRGRTWTLSAPGAITPMIPGVPADVCPTAVQRPFRRADMSTRVILGRDDAGATPAVQRDDAEGIRLFGIEPFERLYLVTEDDDELARLAARVLETRGYRRLPRIRGADFDAATSDGALDLMATVDVFKPSRYRCRLQLDRGVIFDEEMLATGVLHELEPNRWRTAIALDTADAFAVVNTRWDTARWDVDVWSIAV